MCPVCGENNFNLVGLPAAGIKVSKILKQDYKVVQCNFCSIYFVYPQIDFSISEWEHLYGNEYFHPMTKFHEKRREKDRIYRFNNIEKYSNKVIKNFLDIGCGEGYGLLEANSRGWEAFGIDISDNRIEQAKKNNIHFINTDLINASFPENYFDVVYVDSVLEHVINPYEHLVEIKRILRKGGILYFAVPNEDSLLNDLKYLIYKATGKKTSPRLKPFKTPYHIIGYNKKSLMFILQNINLKARRIRNFANRLEFLKAEFLTREFMLLLIALPVYLLAVPLRKEVYLEGYIEKV